MPSPARSTRSPRSSPRTNGATRSTRFTRAARTSRYDSNLHQSQPPISSQAKDSLTKACGAMWEWLHSDPAQREGSALGSDNLDSSPRVTQEEPESAGQQPLASNSGHDIVKADSIKKTGAFKDKGTITPISNSAAERQQFQLGHLNTNTNLGEDEGLYTATLKNNFQMKREANKPADNTLPPSSLAPVSQDYKSTASPEIEQTPLAAPLHVIQRSVPQEKARHEKQKRSMGAWSLSDLAAGQRNASTGQNEARNENSMEHPNQSYDYFESIKAEIDYIVSLAWVDIGDDWFNQWIQSVAEPPVVNLPATNGVDYRHCDIDACSGKLLPAIEQPETVQCHTKGPCRSYKDIGWRRCHMTSELYIAREVQGRQRLGNQLRLYLNCNQAVAKPIAEPAPDNELPNAHCVLRPAVPADFQQIADMINLESQSEHPQILESKNTTTMDMKKLFNHCRKNKRPFIVAVPAEDGLMDQSKWPRNSDKAYKEYVQFKKSQTREPAPVVGFAFIGEPRVGFLNKPCPGSRFSGQVRVVVHPEHRRSLYGSALLDKIIACTYSRPSLVDYEWQCSETEHVYDTCSNNIRQYSRLHVEVFCESSKNGDIGWRGAVLAKFGFAQMAHFRQYVRTDRCGASQWLDLVLYESMAQHPSKVRDRRAAGYLQKQD